MWQLGQIYTSDVKISSVYVETEQTSRVSALAVVSFAAVIRVVTRHATLLPTKLWTIPAQLLLKANSWQIFGNSTCRQLLKFIIKWNRYCQLVLMLKTQDHIFNWIVLIWTLVHLRYTRLNFTRFKWIIKAFSGMCVPTSITFSVIWSSLLISVTWGALPHVGWFIRFSE